MNASPARRPALVVLVLVLLGSVGAAAQQTPLPTPRDEREPNAAAVREAERAAGVAPGTGAASQQTRTLEQIEGQLTGRNPGAAVPPTALPPANPAGEARSENQLFRELTGQNPNAATPPNALPPANPAAEARSENQLFRELTGQNPNAPVTPR